MKRNLLVFILAAITCLVIGCLIVPVPTETSVPAPTMSRPSLPPSPTSMSLPSPTSISLPSPTPVQEALLCTVDPLAGVCSIPKVGTLSKFCVKKIPYTLLGIPPASTFQPMDPALICKDESVWGEVREVSCTGQQLYSYEIKVCDANCSASPLVTGTGQCAEGYGYNPGGNCCWPTSSLEAGCVVYKVDIGACQ